MTVSPKMTRIRFSPGASAPSARSWLTWISASASGMPKSPRFFPHNSALNRRRTYRVALGVRTGATTVFWAFSFTKVICKMAAMLLIEQGKLSFDTQVVDMMSEFAAMQVLDGFDGDSLRRCAPNAPATIRHLATHISGLENEI